MKLLIIILLTISLKAQDQVYVYFSEPIDSNSVYVESFVIKQDSGSEAGRYIEIYSVHTRQDTVILITEEHPRGKYLVHVFGIRDLAGNIIGEPNQTFYRKEKGRSEPQTTKWIAE